MRKGSLKNNS